MLGIYIKGNKDKLKDNSDFSRLKNKNEIFPVYFNKIWLFDSELWIPVRKATVIKLLDVQVQQPKCYLVIMNNLIKISVFC